MSNWQQWIDSGDNNRHHARKINKNYFCKKNKIGNNRFGSHIYEGNDNHCKLCGHVRKNNEQGEINEHK